MVRGEEVQLPEVIWEADRAMGEGDSWSPWVLSPPSLHPPASDFPLSESLWKMEDKRALEIEFHLTEDREERRRTGSESSWTISCSLTATVGSGTTTFPTLLLGTLNSFSFLNLKSHSKCVTWSAGFSPEMPSLALPPYHTALA